MQLRNRALAGPGIDVAQEGEASPAPESPDVQGRDAGSMGRGRRTPTEHVTGISLGGRNPAGGQGALDGADQVVSRQRAAEGVAPDCV